MDRLLKTNRYNDENMDSGFSSTFDSSRSSDNYSSVKLSPSNIEEIEEAPPSPNEPTSLMSPSSEFIPIVADDMEDSSVYNNSVDEFEELSMSPTEPTWLTKVDEFFARKIPFSEENIHFLVRKFLRPQELEQATKELWEIRHDGLFGALIYAYHGDDCLVNFAVWIAPTHEVLNQASGHGQTLLHIATASCHPWTVRNIFTHGCDLKHKDAWGNNALHVAAMLHNVEVMDQLNRPATYDETRHSLMKVRFKSVRRPEDVNHINNQGMAPAHIAAEAGDSDTLRVLFEVAKADTDIRRYNDGNSPAHLAVESGCLSALEVCLKSGADSEVRNYRGQTSQQLAYLCQDHAMVDLCQENGASPNQLAYAETDQVESDCESIDEQLMNGFDGEEHLVPNIEALASQMEDMTTQ